MSNYAVLKAAIQAAVYTNGNNEITGTGLQSVLLQIANTVGDGYIFMGVGTAGTAPGTPDANVFYLLPTGSYSNFGSTFTIQRNYIGVAMYNGSWTIRSISLTTDAVIGDQYSTIDMSAVTYDYYVDTSGSIQPYSQPANKYYYTAPILVKKGQGIFLSWDDNGMGGMSFISKASGAADAGPYTPVEGMTRGDASNVKGAKLYVAGEDGYYVISFRNTLYNSTPVIAEYGILSVLSNLKYESTHTSDFYLTEKPNIAPTFNYKGLITGCTVMLSTNHTNSNAVGYIGASGSAYVNSATKIFALSVGELLVLNTISNKITKIADDGKITEGDRIIAKLTNTGFVGELADVFNEQLYGYPYATRTYLNPSDKVLDKYIDTLGAVNSYADYYYSNPVLLESGTTVVIHTIGSGISLICATDESATSYEPLVTAPSGVSTLKIYTYDVKETGYYAFSGWFTDAVMFLRDYSDKNGGSGGDTVPPYYDIYMKGKAGAVLDMVKDGGKGQDAFMFITDTHLLSNQMNSPSLLSYLSKQSYVDKVIFGGDFVRTTNASDADTAENAIDGEMTRQLEFTNSADTFYSVHGNHDITDLAHYGLAKADVRYAMLQRGTSKGIVTDTADGKGMYYYIDNENAGLRYVVFDATPVSDGSTAHVTTYGVDATQMAWLITEAILGAPQGYNFVFAIHVPVVQNASSDNSWSNFANVRTLCDGVKNGKLVTIGGTSYDFSALTGDLLMVISGHTHGDLETYVDGVLHVSTACDAFYPSDTQYYSLWGNNNFARTKDTTSEQLIDVVSVQPSNNIVKMERVGAGYSRVFHLSPVTINAGSSDTLTESVSVESWHIADSTGLTYGTTSPAAYPIPTNTVATISNGVVSALSAGEAIACASDDTNLIREFFYIKVQ